MAELDHPEIGFLHKIPDFLSLVRPMLVIKRAPVSNNWDFTIITHFPFVSVCQGGPFLICKFANLVFFY